MEWYVPLHALPHCGWPPAVLTLLTHLLTITASIDSYAPYNLLSMNSLGPKQSRHATLYRKDKHFTQHVSSFISEKNSVAVRLSLCLSQSLSVSVSVCLILCPSQSPSLSVSLSLSLSVPVTVRLSLCLSQSPSVSVTIRLSLPLSLSVFVRLSLRLSLLFICLP